MHQAAQESAGRDHDGFFSLPLAGFKKLSPVASFFLLLRQKKETKEKATPDRSKARKFVSILRQLRKLAIC